MPIAIFIKVLEGFNYRDSGLLESIHDPDVQLILPSVFGITGLKSCLDLVELLLQIVFVFPELSSLIRFICQLSALGPQLSDSRSTLLASYKKITIPLLVDLELLGDALRLCQWNSYPELLVELFKLE